jgi:DamX protein
LKAQIKSSDSEFPLISRERTEKLELLNHLVTNLAHAIVICGPEGIGKTRLLKHFQDTIMETWMFCCVQGDSAINLEKVQELLAETIAKNMPDVKATAFEKIFDRMAGWNLRIILVIDDAGKLAPGVVEKIIAFSYDKPVIRVVFALTHSELYLKNGTDPAIEDCYQIEIPPLTQQQCGEFLEYLSTLHKPRIQFSTINENWVAALYRQTHGIPGNILAQLPKDDKRNKADYSKLILIGAVLGLIAIALGVQWWSNKQTIAENKRKLEPETQQALAKPTASTLAQPEPVPQPQTVNLDASLTMSKPTVIRNDVIDKPSQIENNQDYEVDRTERPEPAHSLSNEILVQPQIGEQGQSAEKTADVGLMQAATPAPVDEGERWLIGQPAENVTLQLMALSNEQTIIEVMQRHQALSQNLKYLKTKTRSGRDRFVLLYGSYADPGQAKNESTLLPKELQKYWMRKISAIQGEIGTNIQTGTPE